MIEKEKYESTITALYRRNEKFLGLSALLFFGSMFIGFFLAGTLEFLMDNIVQDFKRSVIEGEIQLNTLSIFTHNLRIVLLIYGGGLLMGAITIIFLISNGLFIGYFASEFPLGNFAILTIPHGIFEIPSIIVAGTAGFRLASFLYKSLNDILSAQFYGPFIEKIRSYLKKNLPELEESLLLLGISIVLLFIAALVESNLTLPWAQYVLARI